MMKKASRKELVRAVANVKAARLERETMELIDQRCVELVEWYDGNAAAKAVERELKKTRPRIGSWAVVQPRGQFLDAEDVKTLLDLGARETVRTIFSGAKMPTLSD